MQLVYILPEFCDHAFYHGWHLYERERADGTRNSDGEWGCGLSLYRVRQLCIQIGHVDMPELDRKPGAAWNGDAITLQARFVDEFTRRFPFGLRAWKDRWEYMPAPLGLDTHPDRQIIYKESRLYFAWRNGKQYTMLATDIDDAQNRLEAAVLLKTKEVA